MSYRTHRPLPIDRINIRHTIGGFSWLEHRFITSRYIDAMDTQEELLLYFFLVTVGDPRGVSFYSSERMASLLHMSVQALGEARDGLIDKEFIAYREGVYQVVHLPSLIGEEQG